MERKDEKIKEITGRIRFSVGRRAPTGKIVRIGIGDSLQALPLYRRTTYDRKDKIKPGFSLPVLLIQDHPLIDLFVLALVSL